MNKEDIKKLCQVKKWSIICERAKRFIDFQEQKGHHLNYAIHLTQDFEWGYRPIRKKQGIICTENIGVRQLGQGNNYVVWLYGKEN